MLAVILLAIFWNSCQLTDDQSESKFVTFPQQDSGIDFGEMFLIKSVHKQSWQIGIGFSDNNDCANSFGPQQKGELQDSIDGAFRTWLAPLNHKPNIVDTFNYIYARSYLPNPPIIAGYNIYLLRDGRNFDLSIVIRCESGRSFALRRGGNTSIINLFTEGFRLKRIYSVTSLQKYYKMILLHEIGHAFGLADTYVDEEQTFRYGRSDGGSQRTVGKQPLAIMNALYIASLAYRQRYRLGNDDIAGIRWLYRFYIEKNISSISDCLGDFVYETNTKGCRPRYPLTFAVKQGDLTIITELLTDDTTIDLAQKDSLGNTALHYAAKQARAHGAQIYLFLQKNFSPEQQAIRNLAGQTASEIYNSSLWPGYFLLQANSFLSDRHTDLALPILDSAIAAGYPGTIKRLATESLNIRNREQQNSLLHLAVTQDKEAVVDQLLGHPLIRINLSNNNGDQALHKLSLLNFTSLAEKFLARQDLEINSQNNNGDSALHVAVRAGNIEMTRMLLADSRIDITLTNNESKTARDLAQQLATQDNEYRQIMEMIDDHSD